MKNPIELGPYARPHWSWVLAPDLFPLSPKSWPKCHLSPTQRCPSVTCALGCAQPKRHVCIGVCTRPAWRLVLQAAASPHAPTNSAIHSENTHSLQYLRYSAEQCNPQWTIFYATVKHWLILIIVNTIQYNII